MAGVEELASGASTVAERISEKFVEDKMSVYGTLDAYHQGLERAVGMPSPSLHDSILREHCESADSNAQFETMNYHVWEGPPPPRRRCRLSSSAPLPTL